MNAQGFEKLELSNGTSLSYILEKVKIKDTPSNVVIALHWGWDRSNPVTDSHVFDFHNKFAKPSVTIENTYLVTLKCPYSGWDNEYSITAINEIVDYCLENFEIDESSLALIGYSAGGIGCWYYAQNSTDNIFKIVIPIAARPPSDFQGFNSQYIEIIHGAHDDYFDIKKVRKFCKEFKEISENVNLSIVQGAGHMNIFQYIPLVKNKLSILTYKYQ